MKTKTLFLAMMLIAVGVFAQDRTTVTATSNDISENLDLRAVASIFGDSRDLEDFERRLNDPRTQISNLDLNQDYQVDYLRVVENVEDHTHLILIQAVLGRDLFQDVATIEVERGRDNVVQVQVVGDVFMYGPNYIYEPVYVSRPVIFTNFWVPSYRPYCSSWYWGYYPSYYVAWHPMPVFRYVNHIHVHINHHHHYNYVHHRRSHRAIAMHNRYRASGYEQRHPNRSFTSRQNGVRNAYELQQNTTRNYAATGGIRKTPEKSMGIDTRNQTGGVRQATTRQQTGGVRQAANGGVKSSDVRSGSTRYDAASTGGVRQAPTRNQSTGGIRQAGISNVKSNDVRSGSTRYDAASTGGVRQAPTRNQSTGGVRQAGIDRQESSTGGIRQAPVRNGGTRNEGITRGVRQSGPVKESVRQQAPQRESSVRNGGYRQPSAVSQRSMQPRESVRQSSGQDRNFAQKQGGSRSGGSGDREGGRR